MKNPETSKVVPDIYIYIYIYIYLYLKYKNMCKYAVKKLSFLIRYVPDKYNT